MVKKDKGITVSTNSKEKKSIIDMFLNSFRFKREFYFSVLFDFMFYAILIGIVYLFFTKVLFPNLEILGNANYILAALQSDPSTVNAVQIDNLKAAVNSVNTYMWLSIAVLVGSFFVLKGSVWNYLSKKGMSWKYILYFTLSNIELLIVFVLVGWLMLLMMKEDVFIVASLVLAMVYFFVSGVSNSLTPKLNPLIYFRKLSKEISINFWHYLLANIIIFIIVVLFIILNVILIIFLISFFPLMIRRFLAIMSVLLLAFLLTWAKRYIITIHNARGI